MKKNRRKNYVLNVQISSILESHQFRPLQLGRTMLYLHRIESHTFLLCSKKKVPLRELFHQELQLCRIDSCMGVSLNILNKESIFIHSPDLHNLHFLFYSYHNHFKSKILPYVVIESYIMWIYIFNIYTLYIHLKIRIFCFQLF